MNAALQHPAPEFGTKVLDTIHVDEALEMLGSQYVNYDMQLRDSGRDFHVVQPSEMPLWRDELERFTVLQMLTTHPNSVLGRDSRVQPAGASAAAARATADYLRAHCGQPVRIGGLAAQFGISVRALQLAFRRTYGVTPHEYLREARLQSAHLDLTSDPSVSIAEVAYRWGFSSPSRFSRYYREYFGTPPSAANRRGYAVTDGADHPRELRPTVEHSG